MAFKFIGTCPPPVYAERYVNINGGRVEENIYTSPQSNVDIKENLDWSPTKAIVVATIVDLVGTILVGVMITIVYSAILASSGISPDEIANRLQNVDIFSTYSVVGTGAGCLVTLYASYLCAKKVNYSEYKFVSIFCAISISLGFIVGGSFYSIGEIVALSGITAICVYVGAWFHVRRKT